MNNKKWAELQELFGEYVRIIKTGEHRHEDGYIKLSFSRNVFLNNSAGWFLVHDGYNNTFYTEAETVDDVIDRGITKLKELIAKETTWRTEEEI